MKKNICRGWLQSVIAVLLSASLLMTGCSGAGTETVADTADKEWEGEESGEEPGTDVNAYRDDGVDYSRAMAQRFVSQAARTA